MTRRLFHLGLVAALFGAVAAVLLGLPQEALAQSVTLDLGDDNGSTTKRIVQLVLLITVITVAPSILLMVTSFTRIVVVFSILRVAMGTNTTPPNMVLVSLAMFLTFFIMQPTFEEAWDTAVVPMVNEQIDEFEAFDRATKPFHDFMMRQVRERDLELMVNIAGVEEPATPEATPLRVLVPAFMISELRRAFEIGFLLYVPFIVIDMVVASVLMSMGMMMLPPMMIALPLKLVFFVLVDGWYVLVGSLVQSFGG
ncbi:Flagellar biosynthesis protein FliP [Caenispirillum salinarum AK4]|uniref:Flagellar biosynthetic protein FliP n=1 Tax=Caenispirillum salinarum AK4 TaxID=1238182 RepID=K9HDA0_9PROT|nr:flagellar type III secretion system pore protein FliP [Caenispirillum salinarum]EKV26686.1 Flagellar biosynthesis protein FliP [Caenispirillum salinarum AK4]